MESDIQRMIETNRVTRLLQKMRFLSRHRRILAYSHRYIITADDLNRQQETDRTTFADIKPKEDSEKTINELMDDFDPENNDLDRRIFYEVTRR